MTATSSRHGVSPWETDGAIVCIVHSRHVRGTEVVSYLGDQHFVAAMPAERHVTDDVSGRHPDAVVIDATVGDFDALRLCRDINEATGIPVVVVTRGHGIDDADIIGLLDAGAADVVPADATPAMLQARVRAAMRWSPPRRRPRRLVVGDVVIDVAAHAVYIDDRPVACSPLMFSLLVTLASAPNTVATRESLLLRVWGVESGSADTRRVRVAVSLLRRLLGTGPRRPRLETVARVGYRLAVD
jgi:two-component system response regulator MtrA